LVDDAVRGRDIIDKPREGLLDDAHVISVFFQDVINAAPSGTIGVGAMHEYDVLYRIDPSSPSFWSWTGSDHRGREGHAKSRRHEGGRMISQICLCHDHSVCGEFICALSQTERRSGFFSAVRSTSKNVAEFIENRIPALLVRFCHVIIGKAGMQES